MTSFQQLGRYLLVEKIASGGMADVYRGKLPGVEGFEKDVAIKKILPYWSENREFIDMLVDEAKVLLHLAHSNIVQVYELNREGNIYFIVMEYVDGVDLRKLSAVLAEKGRVLSPALACYVAQQICQGLQFAHEKKDRLLKPLGIVHRDISPQNILIGLEGEVKITDFGIAKIFGKTTETVTGTLKGKFAYMSPEQAVGEAVDYRTDIFAMGILLYEMVTGLRCFKGKNDLETLEAVKKAEVHFPPECLKNLPEMMRSIIVGAMKKERDERYQSIALLRNDLRALENKSGYIVSASDLKALLYDLLPEKYVQKREREEELSQKTRLHVRTRVTGGRPSGKKTRILVSAGKLGQKKETPPVVNSVATFILEKTVPALAEFSKTVVGQFSGLKKPPARKTIFYAVCVFAGIIIAVVFLPERDSGESLTEDANHANTVKVAAPLAPPVLLPEAKTPAEPGLTAADDPAYVFTAHLKVSAEPEGSEITIAYDGNEHVQKNENMQVLELDREKEVIVSVKNEGWFPASEKVVLSREHPDFEKSYSLKKAVYGGLAVGAKPWGRVFLPGVVSGAETPFSRQKILAGSYNLKVVFPPQQKTVSAEINIGDGEVVRCQAMFGEQARINCR